MDLRHFQYSKVPKIVESNSSRFKFQIVREVIMIDIYRKTFLKAKYRIFMLETLLSIVSKIFATEFGPTYLIKMGAMDIKKPDI